MGIGLSVLIVAILIIGVWVIIETKRMKHKMLAVFLIGLILFSYFSFTFVFKEADIDFQSVEGISSIANLYFSWIGTVFLNFKTLTAKAINLDWKGNETG